MRAHAMSNWKLSGAILVAGLLGAGPALAQAAHGDAAVPRTAWGDPDLRGIWNSTTSAPFERPADGARGPARNGGRPRAGDPGTYDDFWSDDRSGPATQSSQVVDPPDGRLPPLTAAGEAAAKSRTLGNSSWEDRHLWERCITRGGMPNAMFPRFYNNNAEIFQSPGFVAILLEEIHETRVIPLDHRPHLPDDVRQWMGDSRGHWEGNTLVVETKNLASHVSSLQPWTNFSSTGGSGERLQMVERFTRTSPDTIEYSIRVEDPEMYSAPWTVAYPMTKTDELLYEYACHEANYGLRGVLAAGQAEREGEAPKR